MNEKELIEKLASIDHDMWMGWARDILSEEVISTVRVQRWAKNLVPYDQLSEKEKEKNRFYARKIVRILKEHGVLE
jgi:hypothetical protein